MAPCPPRFLLGHILKLPNRSFRICRILRSPRAALASRGPADTHMGIRPPSPPGLLKLPWQAGRDVLCGWGGGRGAGRNVWGESARASERASPRLWKAPAASVPTAIWKCLVDDPLPFHHPVAGCLALVLGRARCPGLAGPRRGSGTQPCSFIRPLARTISPPTWAAQRQISPRPSDHKEATELTFILSGAQ